MSSQDLDTSSYNALRCYFCLSGTDDGGLLNVILHAPWFLTNIGPATLLYIVALLPIVASRETKPLAQEFGDEFLKYQEQVHAFLPLRKFKG